jgi:hypothetical protein
VIRRFVLTHGGTWHDDAQATMIGMLTPEWAQYIHHDLGVALPPPKIAALVVDGVKERLAQSVPILPGAQKALERLARAFSLGLATSAALPVARANGR